VALPDRYIIPLGFPSADSAVEQKIVLAITDTERTQHFVDAQVVGVAEESLTGVAQRPCHMMR
jgi:putative ABC transport system permease protein